MLRQTIDDGCPRRFGFRPNMHCGFRHAPLIDHAQWNAAKLRQPHRLVAKRGTACRAKDPEAAAGVEFGDVGFGGRKREPACFRQPPSSVVRAGEFSAIGAMPIS